MRGAIFPCVLPLNGRFNMENHGDNYDDNDNTYDTNHNNSNNNRYRQAEAYVMDRQFSRAIRAYLALAEYRASDHNGDEQDRWDGDQRSKEGAGAAAAAAASSTAPNSVGLGGVGGEKGRGGGVNGEGESQYAHVFRMIEQHSLFDTVQVRRGRGSAHTSDR